MAERLAPAAPGLRVAFQFAFERAGAGEEAAVEAVELIGGCEEHESAGYADGDADRAAVELDCETLVWH
jgi:hypothetical protein